MLENRTKKKPANWQAFSRKKVVIKFLLDIGFIQRLKGKGFNTAIPIIIGNR